MLKKMNLISLSLGKIMNKGPQRSNYAPKYSGN